MKHTKCLVIPDTHAPKQNVKAVKTMLRFAKDWKPDICVHLGDLCDFASLSRFRTVSTKELISLKEEISEANNLLDEIEEALPKGCQKILTMGNHDQRPEIYRLNNWCGKSMKLLGSERLENAEELYCLPSRGWKWLDYGKVFKIGHCLFTHGWYINQYHASKTVKRWFKTVVYGHCFSEDTELLTQNGWKKYGELSKSDEAVGLNKKTGLLEYTRIKQVYTFDNYNKLCKIKSKHVDLMVTDKHGMVYRGYNNKLILGEAQNFGDRKVRKLITSGVMESMDFEIDDDLLRLVIWIATDGSYENSSLVRFHLRKSRKIERLSALLKRMNIPFSCNTRTDGTVGINFTCNKLLLDCKPLPQWIRKLSPRQALIVLEEYSNTDGNKQTESSYQICSYKEEELDLLQDLFVRSGLRCIKGKKHLAINTRKDVEHKSDHFSIVPYSGKVWCASVPLETLLVRRNGKVCITQNSHQSQSHTIVGQDRHPVEGISIGCLQNLDACYLNGLTPDWVHMFMYIDFWGDNFTTHPIKIIDGKFYAEGKLYE